ncbi:MAG: GerMN domain-containing protein [Candidatus Longimicrobiales bacterium M2_2A_002]
MGLLLGVLAVGACDRPSPEPAAGRADTAADSSVTDADSIQRAPGWDVDPGDTVAMPPLTGFDTVFVYFTNTAEEQVPAPRAVPGSLNGLRAAFTELLEGPTPAERRAGLQSWFSRETAGMLRSVRLDDGFVVVDFQDLRPVIPNAVSSAGALMLVGELTATAFQFPAVERVEFRIDGSCEALMAWLQFGCSPIRRASWEPPADFRTAVR